MSRNTVGRIVVALLLAVAPAAARQDAAPADAADTELREALRSHFLNRLHVELALTDEQRERVTPLVERLELERRSQRNERMAALRALRQAYRGGAPDARLQELLDRLDRIETRARDGEREVQARIDAELTVRQRVQYRFFVSKFRQEINRRVQDARRRDWRERPRDRSRERATPRRRHP